MVESLLIAKPFRPVRPVLESIGEYNVALFDPFDPIEDDEGICPDCDDFLDEEGNCPNDCEIAEDELSGRDFEDDDYFEDDLDDVDYFDEDEGDFE